MIRKIKNWWVEILGFAAIVLDQGFELLEPLLNEIGVPDNRVKFFRIIFGAYAIFLVYKRRMPTQNTEKLQGIVAKKIAETEGIVGDRPKDSGGR